jgi:hypothetical protein
MSKLRIKGLYKLANMKRVSATVRGRKLPLHDAWTGGPGWAGLTELKSSFTYGLRRPCPSSPDVPRAAGPQGAVSRQRVELKGLSFETEE